MAVKLVVEEGPLTGMVLFLEEGSSWSIGRDAKQSDIAVEDVELAPCQVEIFRDDEGYHIKLRDSSKKVEVNEQVLQDQLLLKDFDVIVLGSNKYTFCFEKAEDFDEALFFEIGEGAEESAPRVPLQEGGASAKKNNAEGKEIGEVKIEGASSGAEGELTDKDKALSEAFLKSAKEGGGVAADRVDIPDSQPAPSAPKEGALEQEAKEQKIDNMGEGSAAKNSSEEGKSLESQENIEQSDPQEGAEAPVDQKGQSQGAEKEENSQEEESSQESETAAAAAKEEEKKEEASEEGKEENPVEAPKEGEGQEGPQEGEAAAKEETSSEAGKEGDAAEASKEGEDKAAEGQEKSEQKVLAPFDIKDLFDFDKGIFPASVDDAGKDITVDLSRPSRFLLKVLAGANIGAEFQLEVGREYTIGSNADVCDIVFNDTSVSHQHAKLVVGADGAIVIQDLGSKNGVVVEGTKIENDTPVSANMVVALGTTLFLLIDQQAPAETIVANFAPENYGLFGRQDPKEEIDKAEAEAKQKEEELKRATLPTGTFILTLFIGGLAVLFGIGTASLFHSTEVISVENVDYQEDLEEIARTFPGVRYTFNKTNGQLFLVGHVKNGIEKSELLYRIDALTFVRSVDDNVIDDEAVWQEMNILLSKRPEFKGISMSSPEPGRFVLTGYVKSEEQAVCLVDYLNLHFQYLSLLDNCVVVESVMLRSIEGRLLQNGFGNIQVSFINGELILTGYVNNGENGRFRKVVQELGEIPGVRIVKNFAVLLPAEEGLIDLSHRYPNRYRVTGYSKYGDVSINVVVNGRILTRGDVIDGMTVTGIQPNSIFLEKEGLKYKIDYNK